MTKQTIEIDSTPLAEALVEYVSGQIRWGDTDELISPASTDALVMATFERIKRDDDMMDELADALRDAIISHVKSHAVDTIADTLPRGRALDAFVDKKTLAKAVYDMLMEDDDE